MTELLHSSPRAEVYLGSCLDESDVAEVMGERKADLVCLDAPYSDRTHRGHDDGANPDAHGGIIRRRIDYPPWTEREVRAFMDVWQSRSCGWIVSITDHFLAPVWHAEMERLGRYTFAPLPLVESGSRCRLSGDGPSSWTCWVVVSRPATSGFSRWGTLPGAYVQPSERDAGSTRVVGGKPLSAMLRIIGDYSRRGGLVVDPTCGGGTTLKAAIMSGRRAIGMDSMREHAELTVRNIRSAKEQTSLFEESA